MLERILLYNFGPACEPSVFAKRSMRCLTIFAVLAWKLEIPAEKSGDIGAHLVVIVYTNSKFIKFILGHPGAGRIATYKRIYCTSQEILLGFRDNNL